MSFTRKYKNFKLDEFITSPTALSLGIDNLPDFEEVAHLEELVSTILQPLRTALGYPLIVTSGYRCKALNNAVGGVSDSAHQYGYAADIQIKDMVRFPIFLMEAENWLRENNVAFDQSIIEQSRVARWWHIAVRDKDGNQRRQFLSLKI